MVRSEYVLSLNHSRVSMAADGSACQHDGSVCKSRSISKRLCLKDIQVRASTFNVNAPRAWLLIHSAVELRKSNNASEAAEHSSGGAIDFRFLS